MTRLGLKGISWTGAGAPAARGLKKSRDGRTPQSYGGTDTGETLPEGMLIYTHQKYGYTERHDQTLSGNSG